MAGQTGGSEVKVKCCKGCGADTRVDWIANDGVTIFHCWRCEGCGHKHIETFPNLPVRR